MSLRYLTQHQARLLVSEIFVNSMPFNQALGLTLQHLDDQQATLILPNRPSLTGNALQKIVHGGVIASVLDVAAGLVCVNYALTRQDRTGKEVSGKGFSGSGQLNYAADTSCPARGKCLTPPAHRRLGANK